MAVEPGATLGSYEILSSLGAGGMGRVYRARDTTLGRDVAIKVLPEEFSQDTERLARLRREAQLLGSLNHPSIATLYGLEESDGELFLVMELVEGEDLSVRLAKGPLPIDEAISIARQVAEAVEEAHEKGVIHRDLKPANIKILPDGRVKVLDFGLAKAYASDGGDKPAAELSQSPTLTRQTAAGVILGTAAYMSPEQAKGKQVDKRADIWAFGAVVFEMLAGRRLFEGEDVSETLAAVLRAEPDWEALPPQTPRSVRRLLERCLTRDLKKRLRDIGEARILLEESSTEATDVVTTPVASASRKRWASAVVAALALGFIAGIAFWSSRRPPPAALVRYAITLQEGDRLFETSRHSVALSPDGSRLVYVANNQLYLRPMDQMEAVPIRGAELGRSPFFSPDGQWIGYWSDGLLKKVPAGAGAPITLCEATNPYGASWSSDGTILFGQGPGGILRVSENGGEPEVVVAVEGDELAHGPQMLPGGTTLLFTLADNLEWNDVMIVAQSLETGERRTLVEGGSDARYAPSGHLVYAIAENLVAVRFDAERVELLGGAVPVVEGVLRSSLSAAAHFSFSERGTLVWVPGNAVERELVWVDRAGQLTPLTERRGGFAEPRLSPDGARLAVNMDNDIWILDIARDTLSPFTTEGRSSSPEWSPDGEWIAFHAGGSLYRKRADFSGEAELILESELTRYPSGWSPDGNWLAYAELGGAGNVSASVVSIQNGGEPRPLLETRFIEADVRFSPDGRWITYTSERSGRFEIYVQPFEGSGGWVQISTNGGNDPLWSRDGEEIFYTEQQRVMVVEIETEPELRAEEPELLFEGRFIRTPRTNHDVTADGKRFVMVHASESGGSERQQLNVVLNWFQELERLAPAN